MRKTRAPHGVLGQGVLKDPMEIHAEARNRPIGIFDSGIGGLTVLKALKDKLPHESFIYFGDLAHSPYGTKSKKMVKAYARAITRFLLAQEVKLIVIACNTASASAAQEVRRMAYPVPVLEVVEYGVEAALQVIRQADQINHRVGVLGTPTTVSSEVYVEQLQTKAKERDITLEIQQAACPLFVPLAEEGLWQGEIPRLIAEMYLHDMHAFAPDVVILGCTHYPLLRGVIADQLPESTKLVDSASLIAERAKQLLEDKKLLRLTPEPGSIDIYSSDSEDTFRRMATRFLDMAVDIVHYVELDACEESEG